MNNYMKTVISGLKQWVSSQKSDWNQNDSSAANFIKNKPFYSEEKEKVLFSGAISQDGFTLLEPLVKGNIYTVIFNGVTYKCLAKEYDGYIMIGNNAIYEYDNGIETDTGEPFAFEHHDGGTDVWAYFDDSIAEAPSVTISGITEVVHQIDKKFVPMPDLADVAHTGDYYDLQNTPYIPWDTVQYATNQSLTDGNKKIARNNIGAASATDVSNLSTLVGDTAVSTQIDTATDKCITGLSVSGQTITYTKGDGTTGTIKTQDTNTTYNISNGKASGSLRGTGASFETSDYALGTNAIALGLRTKASGLGATAFGYETNASGNMSLAEGGNTTASGHWSHAEGASATASGSISHAEGSSTTASGNFSHAEGIWTIAASEAQHVQGRYNIEDSANKYAHIVGNGFSDTASSNAHTLDWNGLGWFKGGLKVGGESQDDPNAVEVALKSDVNAVSALVGDTSVSDQISEAINNIGTSGLAQSDWNASENESGHILNRTHWKKEIGTQTLFSGAIETYYGWNSLQGNPVAIEIEVGATYSVIYDGATYEVVGKVDAYNVPYIGSESLWNNSAYIQTEEPFSYGDGWFAASSDGTHNVTISGNAIEWHTIEKGYLSGSLIQSGDGYKSEVFNDVNNNAASGTMSHAEGSYTLSSGNYSHAEGYGTQATGIISHAEGVYTIASSQHQHVQGQYNIVDSSNKYAHIVGNGTTNAKRSNAHTVDWHGVGWFKSGIKVGGSSQDDSAAVEVALKSDLNGLGLPAVTAADNGKILRVVNGAWAVVSMSNAEEASF